MVELSIIAAILSIAASVKKLMEKNKLSKEDALNLYRQTANQQEIKLLNAPENEVGVFGLLIISGKLLDQLKREAIACEDKHIEARENAAEDLTLKEAADIKASGCMCSILRSIRIHNGMKLPDGPFDAWWRSYNCN